MTCKIGQTTRIYHLECRVESLFLQLLQRRKTPRHDKGIRRRRVSRSQYSGKLMWSVSYFIAVSSLAFTPMRNLWLRKGNVLECLNWSAYTYDWLYFANKWGLWGWLGRLSNLNHTRNSDPRTSPSLKLSHPCPFVNRSPVGTINHPEWWSNAMPWMALVETDSWWKCSGKLMWNLIPCRVWYKFRTSLCLHIPHLRVSHLA